MTEVEEHDRLFFFEFAYEEEEEEESPFRFNSQPIPPVILVNQPQKQELSYKPKKTRGTGAGKEGYCESCDRWFKLKTSSYWYHMHYKHGISVSGRVCPELIKRDRNFKVEGFCKECNQWIVLGSARRNARFGWYKHWQKLHSKAKTI